MSRRRCCPGRRGTRWTATRMTAGPTGRADSKRRTRTSFQSSEIGRTGLVAILERRTGSSWGTRATEAQWVENLEKRNVWQARHGGPCAPQLGGVRGCLDQDLHSDDVRWRVRRVESPVTP